MRVVIVIVIVVIVVVVVTGVKQSQLLALALGLGLGWSLTKINKILEIFFFLKNCQIRLSSFFYFYEVISTF